MIVILFSLITICSAFEHSEKTEIIDDILFNGLLVNPDLNVKGVINELGDPLRTETKLMPNTYTGIDDEITFLYYEDLEVWVFTTKGLKKNWSKVSKVIVSGEKYALPHNLIIGLREKEVEKILGVSSIKTGKKRWYYFPSEPEPHLQLILDFDGGALIKLTWSYMP
jgi:hypothetical protein